MLEHEVEFILVGALSAVLQGAPVMTVDVDLVHRREKKNIDALLDALERINAYFRGHPGKQLRPTRQHLQGKEHQLLSTDLGPLDLLGTIEDGLSYEDLLPDTVEAQIGHRSLRILTLAKYVALKEESSRTKDQARLPMLRETLRYSREKSDNEGD